MTCWQDEIPCRRGCDAFEAAHVYLYDRADYQIFIYVCAWICIGYGLVLNKQSVMNRWVRIPTKK